MKAIAIGVLGLVLVHGGVAAQTPAEQAQILRDFQQNVANYAQRQGPDMFPEALGASTASPRIFTLPVAMVFRQLIAGAIAVADVPALTPMPDVSVHHPAVLERFPATKLNDFPPVLDAALPPLPEGLEYRLLGNDLALRDGQADLIVAVLRDAVGAVTTVKR